MKDPGRYQEVVAITNEDLRESHVLCSSCNGSGEGSHETQNCIICGGAGEVHAICGEPHFRCQCDCG